MAEAVCNSQFRQILGLSFFHGSAAEAADIMERGGLLVVPAAPALKNLPHDPEYRDALLGADLIITDSSFMVLVWNLIQRDTIRRLSGLTYIRELIKRPDFRHEGQVFWIMPSTLAANKNIAWLQTQGVKLADDSCYVAPMYGYQIDDPGLLNRLRERRPKHVIVTLGGGTQERLGLYLKRNLDYSVAIHCTGAAISFLSGDQVHIPSWADKLYLGWLFRTLADPKRYGPRYWDARHLASILVRNRDRLPELQLSPAHHQAAYLDATGRVESTSSLE
jgi:UDP-N-acetyl-D-mannosaminuronic acid transferase (WecB/TagA/CpsF family)